MTDPHRPVPPAARVRVIVDNDFSGDPDDLFQLAHHALSPSVHIPFVIGSHLREGDPFDASDRQARNAVEVARGLLAAMGADIPVLCGSETALPDPRTALPSAASDAIVAEALRTDTDVPLMLAAGGGLTEIASALLREPAVVDRLTVVWIGGPEYPGRPVPPGAGGSEYNLRIDVPAARAVFASRMPLWQVPRDAYRQALVGMSELETRVRPQGELGALLFDAIDRLRTMLTGAGMDPGETYALGDSPLVLLTALQTTFEPDTASSDWEERPRPSITADGEYGAPAADAAPVRVYTRIDTRLMFEDLFAKLALWHARRRAGAPASLSSPR